MSLILRQLIGEQRGRRMVPTSADPHLKNQLANTQKNLNSILKKWKWDGEYPTSSQEFLVKFEPWVNDRIKENKELKVFLSKWGSTSLNQLETTWQNTERDYLRRIEELQNQGTAELSEDLKEKLRNYDDLEMERDELARDKTTLEQEVLATNNRLNLKNQEVNNKEAEITRLKKEASEKEKALNKTIKDWKEKYDKKVKQLDIEQTEANKLENKIEELQAKITELETTNLKLVKELTEK
jgi:chromosome segregation ATPase